MVSWHCCCCLWCLPYAPAESSGAASLRLLILCVGTARRTACRSLRGTHHHLSPPSRNGARHGVADSSRLPRPIRRSLMPMVMTCTAALLRQRRSSGTLSLPKCCWGCAVWRTRRASALHGGAGAGAVSYLHCCHGVSRRLPIW